MILFILINIVLVSFVNNEEADKSSIFLYKSEIEGLQSYNDSKLALLRQLQNFKCEDDMLNCSGFGKCNEQKNDCICDVEHTTFPLDSPRRCNYALKKQLTAFLCELFLGFGAGHFYTERYSTAGAKLACFLFGIYIICLFPITTKCVNDKCDSDWMVITVACFYYCCVIGLAFWFIYDLVMFGMNKYLDGNSQQLLPWGIQSS